jgi:hypothetical protein
LKTGGGWSHPVHIHFEEGVILARDGQPPPPWETFARKDVYRIGNGLDSSQTVTLAIRFREFAGTFMEHCHNTQHEDHSMLLRWDLERPGQTMLMPAPIPTWDGVQFEDSAALPTFRAGEPGADTQASNGASNDGTAATSAPAATGSILPRASVSESTPASGQAAAGDGHGCSVSASQGSDGMLSLLCGAALCLAYQRRYRKSRV